MKGLYIDPGYATQGLVVLEFAPGKIRVLESVACKTAGISAKGRPDYDVYSERIDFMVGCAYTVHARHPDIQFSAVERWDGGRNPMTTYWRGRMDDRLWTYLSAANVPPRILNASGVKAMLHPEGRAVDSGRKTDLEFMNALLMLDRAIEIEDLDRVKQPEILGAKTWKQGRLHTLDAGAMGVLDAALRWFDTATGTCAYPALHDAQAKVVREIADKRRFV